jgi:hypothetical protein
VAVIIPLRSHSRNREEHKAHWTIPGRIVIAISETGGCDECGSLDNPEDRRAQVDHLINESRKGTSNAIFIAGDYNANLAQLRDSSFRNFADENWMLNLRSSSIWITLDTVWPEGFSRL